MLLKDQLDRLIYLEKTPKRIVSLVPSQTELLCYLGLEEAIVGVTKFCVKPKHLLKEKVVVGGTKNLHTDRIIALEPDIICCNKEENTEAIVRNMSKIAPVHVSDINTIEDCLELITMYGLMLDVNEKALLLSNHILNAKIDFQNEISLTPVVEVAYFIWKDPWMVAGSNTYINYMLALNGFKNHFQNLSRYPEVSITKKYPDVNYVFLSSEPFPFSEKHIHLLQPYFPNATIWCVDGEMFSWYGSRLLKSFEYFKKLHQKIKS